MTLLSLSEREQRAMRSLLAADPVPGSPLPAAEVFGPLSDLIPCDGMGAVLMDGHHRPVARVHHPGPRAGRVSDSEATAGPLYLGVMHWSRHPRAATSCGALEGLTDGVAVGFRNGADHVAQLWFERIRRRFATRDLAMISVLLPVLQRLMRERPTPQLPASLTVQERRVLMQVAGGKSNLEIALHLSVAPSTVRKHLEHIYRKLGVTSRTAAVARLQGRDQPDLDLRGRIERYA